MTFRWDPYLLLQDDLVLDFWNQFPSIKTDASILYIMGKGFDPRMNQGIKILLQSEFQGECTCLTIEMLDERQMPKEEFKEAAQRNMTELEGFVSERFKVEQRQVELWKEDGGNRERTGPDQALRLIKAEELSRYKDVVLDISSLSRGVYFPILASLLKDIDNMDGAKPNLHVFVAEDSDLDRRIVERGLEEDAYYVPYFRGNMMPEAEGAVVWFPIVGPGRQIHLEIVQNLIDNLDEVCPVFPMPAKDPRLTDHLIRDISDFLVNRWQNDPRNFVYVSERNPFQTYRHLVQSVRQYNEALEPIGGCRAVISAHSSKLLSIGALLAAYELRSELQIGLANVDATSYDIESRTNVGGTKEEPTPFLMSLAGTIYES